MPKYIGNFKRKGIAWRKSSVVYVHPPERDQWDGFLGTDQKAETTQIATASNTVRSPPQQQQVSTGSNSCPQDTTTTNSSVVATETTLSNGGETLQMKNTTMSSSHAINDAHVAINGSATLSPTAAILATTTMQPLNSSKSRRRRRRNTCTVPPATQTTSPTTHNTTGLPTQPAPIMNPRANSSLVSAAPVRVEDRDTNSTVATMPPHATQTTYPQHLFEDSILRPENHSESNNDNHTTITKTTTNECETIQDKADDDWSTQAVSKDVISASSALLLLNQTVSISPSCHQSSSPSLVGDNKEMAFHDNETRSSPAQEDMKLVEPVTLHGSALNTIDRRGKEVISSAGTKNEMRDRPVTTSKESSCLEVLSVGDDADSKHRDTTMGLSIHKSDEVVDETSRKGLDQVVIQPSEATSQHNNRNIRCSPCAGVLLESGNFASYGTDEDRTTKLIKMHDHRESAMACDALNEKRSGNEDADLVPKDVYDVLRRLQHKVERKRGARPIPVASATEEASERGGTITNNEEMGMRETVVASNQHPLETGVKSHQDWRSPIVHPHDICLEDSPFHIALRKRGFLDQYIFREEQHLSCIPIRVARHVEVPLGTNCGDDRYWQRTSFKTFEFSLSDTLESNQLLWEAALLDVLRHYQTQQGDTAECRFPRPIELCHFQNKVALTLESEKNVSIMGTLAQVLHLHSIFGMGMIAESIVAWMVLDMIKIIGLLHRAGIAHNRLGLESFLVASDGTKWTLLLNGLGSKSSVQSGDNLLMHLRHDMLSLTFIAWSILTGCSAFKYTITQGEVQLEGLDYIATNIFLRGRDGWKELFSALLDCGNFQGVGSIPNATLDSIQSILRMSFSSEDETTGDQAVEAFFDSLLDMQLKLGGTITDIQFSKSLRISCEELIFDLHFSKSAPKTLLDNQDSLSVQCMPNSLESLNATMEESQSEITSAVAGNGKRKREPQKTNEKCSGSNSLIITPTPGEMSEMAMESQRSLEVLDSRSQNLFGRHDARVREPPIPMEAPTVNHSDDTGSVCPSLTKKSIHQRHSEISGIFGFRVVANSIDTVERPPKRRKLSNGPTTASVSLIKSCGPVESQSTNTTIGGTAKVVEFIPAKSRHYARRKLTGKGAHDNGRRRSCRSHLVCGIEGCKNQFPVDNGYMWVMMVGLEEQADNALLPIVPAYHPMHLVCTSCREPKGDGMFLVNELLHEQDKREICHWDKYLYYKASRVEYEKWLRKSATVA